MLINKRNEKPHQAVQRRAEPKHMLGHALISNRKPPPPLLPTITSQGQESQSLKLLDNS